MTIYGVDVASYQGSVDWKKVHGAGVSFGFSKATQGVTYVSPTWGHNEAGMKGLGSVFLPGAYHFLSADADPAAQARHFLEVVGPVAGMAIALDVEPSGSSKPSATQAKKWVAEFKRRTGGHPVIGYFPGWYHQDQGHPDLTFFDTLWQSHYVNGTGAMKALAAKAPAAWWGSYGGEAVSVLQFSSTVTVPGISGVCDVNMFRGSLAELKAVALPSTTPPDRPPAPRLLKLASPLMHGDDVKVVQRALNKHDAELTVDGRYGARTAAEVRAYQRKNGLTADGIVGPATRKKLGL